MTCKMTDFTRGCKIDPSPKIKERIVGKPSAVPISFLSRWENNLKHLSFSISEITYIISFKLFSIIICNSS